jgi:predicted nucleotidyltransferase
MSKSNKIRELRNNFKLTQAEFATLLGMPVKTIRNWEQGIRIPSEWVLDLIYDKTLSLAQNGKSKVLSFLDIKKAVKEVAYKHNISKVYLFGSYAKGEATPNSDIDLYMETKIKDITHFGIAEEIRERLDDKKIDLLSPMFVIKNSKIDLEIKETGILLYER